MHRDVLTAVLGAVNSRIISCIILHYTFDIQRCQIAIYWREMTDMTICRATSQVLLCMANEDIRDTMMESAQNMPWTLSSAGALVRRSC